MPWYSRWRNVFRPEQLNCELDDELRHHLDETIDRLVAQGISTSDARHIARQRLGNYSTQKEKTRDMNIAHWLDETRADLLYGLRQMKASPVFTAVAVLSLALGIGANTSLFQLINSIRLKTLPVERPQELALIKYAPNSIRSGWGSSRSAEFTYVQWQQLQAQHEPFTQVIAWSADRFDLTRGGQPRFADGYYVSGDFFSALGVPALLGRTFSGADDGNSCNASAVISYSFWQREYGGSNVLGRAISLDGHPFPISAVMPPSFSGIEVGNRYDVAIPLCADRVFAQRETGRISSRTAWWLSAMGRLKPGWTVERASAYLAAISPTFMRETLPSEYLPDLAKRFLSNKLTARPAGNGVSGLREQYDQPLYFLLAISGVVLVIACANIANLLLARATTREAEVAVRLAIGAARARLIRQFLAESLLLAALGTLLGVALSLVLSRLLVALISTSDRPIYVDAGMDWRVLGFAVGLTLVTCILFGLLPALRATRIAPSSAMRTSGRSVTGSRERFSLRRALVVTQIALSFLLLAGALLFVRSFHNLLTNDPGFAAQGVMRVSIDAGKAKIPIERRLAVFKEIGERLGAIPGVESSAEVYSSPLSGRDWNEDIFIDNQRGAGNSKLVFFNRTSRGYFRTMQTRLIAGRDFDEHDTAGSPKVAIVNQRFAGKFLAGVNPLNHTFRVQADAGKPDSVYQIVGIVADTKYEELREDFLPQAFLPIAQNEDPSTGTSYVLRVAGSPASIEHAAVAIAAAVNPSLGIEFQALDEQIAESLLRERLMATLSGAFGVLAALLATLGLYGVISYMVARRRKEIGIRMALGADRSGVVSLVLREAAILLAAGLATGIVLSLWASQLAASLLYGIKPRDPASLLMACALLAAIALLASFVPARRAAAGDPMTALRTE